MLLSRWLAAASSFALCACGPASSPGSAAEPPEQPPTWCSAVDGALGSLRGARSFECLEIPNFLVTGFYGTMKNPERSDFVNGCFAGQSNAADRLRMSVRPVGDLGFTFKTSRRTSTSGRLDLGFLGPWAPDVEVGGDSVAAVDVSVELADAEIRVLSSVGEILGQAFRDAERDADPRVGSALQTCIASLCDGSGEPLVYTAKVLAAVPIIRLTSTASRRTRSDVSLTGLAGFEVERLEGKRDTFELRAREKLNVAAVLEPALPAVERSKTCDTLREAHARTSLASGLRELGLRTLAARDPGGVADTAAALRATVLETPTAFSEHEQRDVLRCVEALEAAAREVSFGPPTRALCETRNRVEELLSANGDDNRLHDLLTDVAQPLHERLTTLANAHALPCADPAFYRDLDGDGFGNPEQMVRAPKAPEGYVVNSLDCYDHNPAARPGQSEYFDRPRGDQSFDYDCDGRATRRSDVVAGGCKVITRFGIPIRCWAEPGWREDRPGCGEQGRWFATCEEGVLACDEGPTEVRRQACR